MHFMKIFTFLIWIEISSTTLCPEKCGCVKNSNTFVVNCLRKGYTNLTGNISSDVTILKFPFNNIKRISEQMFSNFTKLTDIVISHNLIEYVSPNAFDGLDHLSKIDLSENRITKFPWKIIQRTPNLLILYLDNNYITNIPSRNEQHGSFKRLQSLRIHENQFTCSCDVLPFSKWLQENEKRKRSRQKFVTVLGDKSLSCSTLLKWKTLNMLKILTTENKSEKTCVSPILEMISISSANSVTTLSRHVRSVDANNATLEYNLNDPDSLTSRSQMGNHQREPPPTPVWILEKSDEIVFSVVENMSMKILCDVANEYLFTKTNDYILKMTIIGKDKPEIDLYQVKNWTRTNDVTINGVQKNLHDGYRIVCVAESIAGSVAAFARVNVVRISETVKIKSTVKIADEAPTKKQETATQFQTENPRTLSAQTYSTLSYMTSTTKPFQNSTCRKSYNDDVIQLMPVENGTKTIYSYSFDNFINITLSSHRRQETIILEISSNSANMGLMFICHSSDIIRRQWTTVKRGVEKLTINAFYEKPGNVCVLSTHFKIEVCGTFPPFQKTEISSVFMTGVGFSIISLSLAIMAFCAFHRLYFNKRAYTGSNNSKRFNLSPRDFRPMEHEMENYSLLEVSELSSPESRSITPEFSYGSPQYTPVVEIELENEDRRSSI